MHYNPFGYTLDYKHQCAAWTINNQGPARKQCGLPPNHNISEWIYLCNRHYDIIIREIEQEIDTVNSRRVENLKAQLSSNRPIVLTSEEDAEAKRDAAEWMARHERRRREQTVYFIRCEQYVKIGISNNPTSRLKQIRNGGGALFPRLMDVHTAEMIATEPGGFEREKELHAKFAHLRHTGEWFTETPELTEYIESLITKAA